MFDLSIRRALLRGTVVWQACMVVAVLASAESGHHRWWLTAAHVALAAVAVGVEQRRVPATVLFHGACALLVAGWAVTESVDDVLSFATAWMANFSQLLPVMLTKGGQRVRWSLVSGVVVPASVWLFHPDWLMDLVVPLIVTGLAIRWAGRVTIRFLSRYAEEVDARIADSHRARAAAAAARAHNAALVEQARVLHDTVVNTLAAVAMGGAAARDVVAVRDRCARDERSLRALLAGVAAPVEAPGLPDVTTGRGLLVERRGLDAAAADAAIAALPDEIRRAVIGAVGEALSNVAKHAGTPDAELTVEQRPDELTVTVRDRGRGFEPSEVEWRGLSTSIVDRCGAVGVQADITSNRRTGTNTSASTGTEVRLVVRTAGAAEVPSDGGLPAGPTSLGSVSVLRRRACWLWAAAVVAVGFVIEPANRPGEFAASHVGLLVLSAVCLLAWRRADGSTLSPVVATVVGIGAPVVFVLALASVDFGRDSPIAWQAIMVTPLLIVLLVVDDRRWPLALGVGGILVASAGATVAIANAEGFALAAIIPIGTAAALVVLASWRTFDQAIDVLGSQAAIEEEAAAKALAERSSVEAGSKALVRWRDAGLARCATLLGGMADGTLDPQDDQVRAACSKEEEYVRQVLLLDPALVRMGGRFARALATARERGVRLQVRAGTSEPDSDPIASRLGELLAVTLDALPAGAELTASLFPTAGGIRFGLVGPSPLVGDAARTWEPPAAWAATIEHHAGLDVVEAVATSPSGVAP